MPDVCGFWDRSADDPDFNPVTERIEPGYTKRIAKEYEEETKQRKIKTKSLIQILQTIRLPLEELKPLDYEIAPAIGEELTGEILYKGERICQFGASSEQGIYINLDYTEIFENDLELETNNLRRIRKTLDLKNLLNKKGIPYSEELPLTKILEMLRKKMKGFEELIQEMKEFEGLIQEI